MRRESRKGGREPCVTQRRSDGAKLGGGCFIYLFYKNINTRSDRRAGLHADPYSSKLPPFRRQCLEHVRDTLAHERGGSTACCRKHEFRRTTIDDGDMGRQRGRQYLLDALLQCKFALPPLEQLG
jgi:hypothetical protein